MAHFAKLDDNNIVTDVIVVNNEVLDNAPFPDSEPTGVAFCKSLYGADTNWKQTSYSNSFRKNYAGIGYTYRSDIDGFVAPQPFPSWGLNTETGKWEPPVPYPTDGQPYYWDESTVSWAPVD